MKQSLFTSDDFGIAYLSQELNVVISNGRFQSLFGKMFSETEKSIKAVVPQIEEYSEKIKEIITGERDYLKVPNNNLNLSLDCKIKHFHFFRSSEETSPLLFFVQTSNNISEDDTFKIITSVGDITKDSYKCSDFVDKSILGNSPPIKKVKEIITRISGYQDLTVLINGESGTGKSLVAKVLHYNNGGKETPFVTVNCASIPESLLESELFGYHKGAFTNAVKDKPGLIEEAENGTLFLDEIAEISFSLQSKLLTFLEDRKYRRLGGTKEVHINVRVLAATNKDLNKMVEEGTFRNDLYYRLNVVRVEIPPLRKMKADIPLIAMNFINIFNIKYKKNVTEIADDTLKIIQLYEWQGNVRELRNVIERAMVFTEGKVLLPEHITLYPIGNNDEQSIPENTSGTTSVLDILGITESGLSLSDIEEAILKEALKKCNWNQSEAARLLKISREKLRYRIDKYNIK